MQKYKWGIVSDLVRALSNPSNHSINLNDTERETALQDTADIMDTMIVNGCGFQKAVTIEREMNADFAEWLEKVLEKL